MAAPPPPPPAAAPRPAEASPGVRGGFAVGLAPSSSSNPVQYKRTGFVLGGGVGLEVCYTSSCSNNGRSMGLGPQFAAEIGGRPWPFLGFVVAGTASVHPLQMPVGSSNLKGSAVGLTATAGARVYPIQLNALDPWVGVLFGYHHYNESASDDASVTDFNTQRQLRRFVTRLQLGLDIFLTERISIGPYVSFDIDHSYKGVECTKTGAMGANCSRLHEPSISDPPGAVAPGDQPKFISLGALFQAHL
jgi:hypothetical protein